MNIVGILLILTLPYMAGYIISQAFNKREANQIETYLIGFFFLFFLQGVIFTGGYLLNTGLHVLYKAFGLATDVIVVLFLITFIISTIQVGKNKDKDPYRRSGRIKKDEILVLVCMILTIIFIITRIVLLFDYLRTDEMLSMVKAIVARGEVFTINPFTNRPYELGLITSRKIVSLPTYYSYYSVMFGIDPAFLLYIVATIQTLMCTYFACTLMTAPVLRNRRKLFMFNLFLGGLILSGDYFSGAIMHKLLRHGYAGDAIVATVMMPYIIYVLTNAYRQERNGSNLRWRIYNILKLGICLASSMFITQVVSGALLILIVVVTLGITCITRFGREEK